MVCRSWLLTPSDMRLMTRPDATSLKTLAICKRIEAIPTLTPDIVWPSAISTNCHLDEANRSGKIGGRP